MGAGIVWLDVSTRRFTDFKFFLKMTYSLQDLRVLVTVARSPNFTEAARQCRVTPAAVSAVVKRLEAALDARLLERNSRGARLTQAGAAFVESANRVLLLLDESEAQLRATQKSVSGTVHVAAPTDLAHAVLGPWFDEFQAGNPRVTLALHVSDSVIDLAREGIDLALRYGQLQDSQMVARRLCVTARVTCAAPSYLARHGTPRTPDDLRRHQCLVFEVGGRPDDRWRFTQGTTVHEVAVSGPRRSNDSALMRRWAIDGLGIVQKSDIDVEHDIAQNRLQPLLTEFQGPRIPLSLVRPSARKPPTRARALAQFLVEKFALRERGRLDPPPR